MPLVLRPLRMWKLLSHIEAVINGDETKTADLQVDGQRQRDEQRAQAELSAGHAAVRERPPQRDVFRSVRQGNLRLPIC